SQPNAQSNDFAPYISVALRAGTRIPGDVLPLAVGAEAEQAVHLMAVEIAGHIVKMLGARSPRDLGKRVVDPVRPAKLLEPFENQLLQVSRMDEALDESVTIPELALSRLPDGSDFARLMWSFHGALRA